MAPLMQASKAPSIGLEDELMKAIDAARARADEVYADGHVTLIDQISAADWASWNAFDENVIVQDPDGLEDLDLIAGDCGELAAA